MRYKHPQYHPYHARSPWMKQNPHRGDVMEGIVDVAKIGILGGVTVGIIGAFQK